MTKAQNTSFEAFIERHQRESREGTLERMPVAKQLSQLPSGITAKQYLDATGSYDPATGYDGEIEAYVGTPERAARQTSA